MSTRSLIEIVCDGNAQLGYGHIRRALTLARRLEQDGMNVRLVALSEGAQRLLPAGDKPSGDAQVVVFDAPTGIDECMQRAQAAGQTTVALDWFGDIVPDVNIAVFPHGEVRAARQKFAGFDYILLREDIVLLPRVAASGEARRVLLVIGGGDLLGQGHAAASLLGAAGLEVTLVQGPLARDTHPDASYRVVVDPPDLPQLMNACDWAVTNGGSCYFEMLSLGKPAYVLPQTDAELKIAQFGRDQGAVLGVGIEDLRPFDPPELAPVAMRGPVLVDGRGSERVSAIIGSLL